MRAFRYSSVIHAPIGRRFALALAAIGLASIAPNVASAAIAGFGDFSGFAINQVDDASPPTVSMAAGSIQLTSRRLGESRSIFATTPQDVTTFTARFTYTAQNVAGGPQQGLAFVLHNAAAGAAAIGPTNAPLGYGSITPSLAVGLQLPGDSVSRTGLFKNGVVGGGSVDTASVSFYSGHSIDVKLTYAGGSFLTEELTDTVTGQAFATTYVLSPALVTQLGASTAYVGFTAATDNVGLGIDQTISAFTFSNAVPEPTTMLTTAGLLSLLGRRRRN